jgi:hypothetical protein
VRLNWPSGFLNYSLYSDLPRTPYHVNCAEDNVIVCRRVYFPLNFVFFAVKASRVRSESPLTLAKRKMEMASTSGKNVMSSKCTKEVSQSMNGDFFPSHSESQHQCFKIMIPTHVCSEIILFFALYLSSRDNIADCCHIF